MVDEAARERLTMDYPVKARRVTPPANAEQTSAGKPAKAAPPPATSPKDPAAAE